MKYRVLIEQDEDGVFVAQVPSLPGCISQGRSRAQALSNIQEAVEAYLESLKAHDEPVAKGTLRALIREAGLTVREFCAALWRPSNHRLHRSRVLS